MEPTFLSEQDRRDRMLVAYYDHFNAHVPFQVALEGLAEEFPDLLRQLLGQDVSGHPRSGIPDWPPGPASVRLEAFARAWSLPADVGLLDLWDSLCDGPQVGAGPTERDPAGARRHRLRVGDRPFPVVMLTAAEFAAPGRMEPPGWRRCGPDPAVGPGDGTSESPAEDWSDLLAYDPTGIVGDVTRRSAACRRTRRAPGSRTAEDVVAANEARVRAQGFAPLGPRRRLKDIERGARYLFKRAVLGMTYAAIADEEAHDEAKADVRVDEVVVRMTVTRWAKELAIPLPRRGRARV